jgi:AraC-like DNA-binding protein
LSKSLIFLLYYPTRFPKLTSIAALSPEIFLYCRSHMPTLSQRPTFSCFPVHLPMGHRLLHNHDTHEFFFCTRGRALHCTDTAKLPTRKGELYLFPAGQLHHCNGLDKRGCEALVLNVYDRALPGTADGLTDLRKALDRICAMALNGENRLPLSPEGQGAVQRSFTRLACESSEQKPGHVAAQSVEFQTFLLTLMRDPELAARLQKGLPTAGAEDRLAIVFRYLENNYMEPITVDAMATMACLSRSHFHSTFKTATGMTLVEYVQHIRVRTAEEMLRTTTMPIMEIALACGYSSLSHFYHVFRRIMGRSPRQVRIRGVGGRPTAVTRG